jgi:tetratricopeptide (TPR) repeat protein
MMFWLLAVLLFTAPSPAQTAASYAQQAVKLSQKKSWDQAIANYKKALALEPNDPLTHYNLALTLKKKATLGRRLKSSRPH